MKEDQQLPNPFGEDSITQVAVARYVFKKIFKTAIEGLLEAEMDEHLAKELALILEDHEQNCRNGKTRRKLSWEFGRVRITTPRDRYLTFKPKLGRKRKLTEPLALEAAIGLVMPHEDGLDREELLEELYGQSLTETFLFWATERLQTVSREWRESPLEQNYSACYFGVASLAELGHEESGEIDGNCSLAFCLGVVDGESPEILGLWKFSEGGDWMWKNISCQLKYRGVRTIENALVDDSEGLVKAFQSVFPKTRLSNYSSGIDELGGVPEIQEIQGEVEDEALSSLVASAENNGSTVQPDNIVEDKIDFQEAGDLDEILAEAVATQPAERQVDVALDSVVDTDSTSEGVGVEVVEAVFEDADDTRTTLGSDVSGGEVDEIPASSIANGQHLHRPLERKAFFSIGSILPGFLSVGLLAIIGVYYFNLDDEVLAGTSHGVKNGSSERVVLENPFVEASDASLKLALFSEKFERREFSQMVEEAAKRESLRGDLLRLMSHNDFFVRVQALKGLSQPLHLAVPDVQAAVRASLIDPDYLVRGFAARVLGRLGGEDSIVALSKQLVVEESDVVVEVLLKSLAEARG